jgi:glycosyltransferase involved in cell wall biosynthesis
MKIAILISPSKPESGGSHSFIEHYIAELCTGNHFKEHELLIINSQNSATKCASKRISFHDFVPSRLGIRQYFRDARSFLRQYRQGVRSNLYFSYQHKLELFLKELGVDFVWSLEPLTRSLSLPYANTIWDLNHRTTPWFPEFNRSGEWELREMRFQQAISRASLNFVSCEYTREEVEYYYRPRSSSIKVIPFPMSKVTPTSDSRLGGTFFYPAQFWEHKNHKILLDAASIVKQDCLIPDFKLIFLGSDQGNFHSVKNYRDELGLSDIVEMPGFVSKDQLREIYSTATALVYPSLLGPDNLPPLEAMAFDCPRLVSDIDGARGIYGDYAAYFDPFNASSLARLMQRISSGELLHDKPTESFKVEHSVALGVSRIEAAILKLQPYFDSWSYRMIDKS